LVTEANVALMGDGLYEQARSNMSEFWRHIAYNFKQGGVRQVAHKVYLRCVRRLWADDAWLLYWADLSRNFRTPKVEFSVRRLAFDALVELQHFRALAFPELIKKRFSSGDTCYGFFIDHTLVHVAWTSKGYLSIESGVTVTVDRCMAIFDCFTVPEHRGKGIYHSVLSWLLKLLHEQGAERALIHVDPGNIASIKGIERAGFQPLYELRRRHRFFRTKLSRSDFTLRSGEATPGRPSGSVVAQNT
jgi:RimJ/RimL family protein N-acetyltransferase